MESSVTDDNQETCELRILFAVQEQRFHLGMSLIDSYNSVMQTSEPKVPTGQEGCYEQ